MNVWYRRALRAERQRINMHRPGVFASRSFLVPLGRFPVQREINRARVRGLLTIVEQRGSTQQKDIGDKGLLT